MRILALSTAIPFPPISGGKLRTYHLLRALAADHELTLIGFAYGEQPAEPPFAVRVVAVPWEEPPLYRQMSHADPAIAQQAADRLAGVGEEPWCVSWAKSDAMAAAVERAGRQPLDLVLIEGTPLARFLAHLPAGMPKVLDFMDVYTRMALRQSEPAPASAANEAQRVQRFEQTAANECQRCLAVSDDEAAAIRDLFGCTQVETVPNGVDTSYFHPDDAEPDFASLLFTGAMSYRPNAEAVQHFAKTILPLVLRELPEARLHVVGNQPPKQIKALAGEHVAVYGFVPDMRGYHRRAAVVVVPLLRGGGTKLKVLEAAAMGKPIVTTSIGAEGLSFRNGQELMVADDPAAFAQAVVRLARDRAAQRTLGAAARRIALQYDWERIGQRLRAIVESLLT